MDVRRNTIITPNRIIGEHNPRRLSPKKQPPFPADETSFAFGFSDSVVHVFFCLECTQVSSTVKRNQTRRFQILTNSALATFARWRFPRPARSNHRSMYGKRVFPVRLLWSSSVLLLIRRRPSNAIR